jgi:hypothetical protein
LGFRLLTNTHFEIEAAVYSPRFQTGYYPLLMMPNRNWVMILAWELWEAGEQVPPWMNHHADGDLASAKWSTVIDQMTGTAWVAVKPDLVGPMGPVALYWQPLILCRNAERRSLYLLPHVTTILLWAGAARVTFNGPRLAPTSLNSMNLLGRKSTNFSAVHGRNRVFEPQDEEGVFDFSVRPWGEKGNRSE